MKYYNIILWCAKCNIVVNATGYSSRDRAFKPRRYSCTPIKKKQYEPSIIDDL